MKYLRIKKISLIESNPKQIVFYSIQLFTVNSQSS